MLRIVNGLNNSNTWQTDNRLVLDRTFSSFFFSFVSMRQLKKFLKFVTTDNRGFFKILCLYKLFVLLFIGWSPFQHNLPSPLQNFLRCLRTWQSLMLAKLSRSKVQKMLTILTKIVYFKKKCLRRKWSKPTVKC